MGKYKTFIKEFSEFYNKGFPIFVSVLAAIFIGIFTNQFKFTVAESFTWLNILLFTVYSLLAIFVSLLVAVFLYLVLVGIFGSLVYLIQKISNYFYGKFKLPFVLISSSSLILIGGILSFYFKFPSILFIIGLLLMVIGIIPVTYTTYNKIEKDQAVPSYIG